MARFLKGNMMNNQQNNNKILTFASIVLMFLGALFLIGCSGGGGSSNSSPSTNAIINPDDISPIVEKPKVVSISRISTIPTNNGVGAHFVEVRNFTGEDLQLTNVKVTNAGTDHISNQHNASHSFSRTHHASIHSKRHVDSHHKSSDMNNNLNTLGCQTIQANASCTLQFTPPSKNGSTSIQLTYKIANAGSNKTYTAAQLINYSSQVSSNNGFLVSNKNIDDIASTNDVLIAIPFVAEDNYSNLTVQSNVTAIEQSVDCSEYVNKYRHCTALLRLPADSYNNKISIKATNNSGVVLSAITNVNIKYENKGNIVITSGPVIINANDISKTLTIMNNGTADMIGLSGEIKGSNSSDPTGGLSTSNVGYSACGTTNGSFLGTLKPNETCTVTITHPGKTMHGHAIYNVKDSSGELAITSVYYVAQSKRDYGFRVSVDDGLFVGVLHTSVANEPLTRDVTVENIGENPIGGFSMFLPSGVSDKLSYNSDPNVSTCMATGLILKSSEECRYQLTYTPSDVQEQARYILTVSAKQAPSDAVGATPVTPEQSHKVAIYTSTTHSIAKIVVSPSDTDELSIVANNFDFREKNITISNSDSASAFTLTNLSILNSVVWPTGLTIENGLGAVNTTGILSGGSVAISSSGNNSITLKYKYGPTTTTNSGAIIKQTLTGKFAGTGASNPDFTKDFDVATFKTVSQTVKVEAVGGRYATAQYADIGASPFVASLGDTVLRKGVFAQAQFKYTAVGATVKGFLINDSNLPFGFMLNKDANLTTCKTASGGDTAQDLGLNTSCVVTYDYLNPNYLTGYMFYTAGTNPGTGEIRAPRFTSKENGAIHVSSSSAEKVTLKPKKFANVVATLNPTTCTAASAVNEFDCTVKFTANDYNPSHGAITITPQLDNAVVSQGAQHCTINTNGGSCTLKYNVTITGAAGATKMIPFAYSLDDYAIVDEPNGITFKRQ